MLSEDNSTENYIKRCSNKVDIHNEQAKRNKNWNTWLNLFDSVISGAQIITMVILAINSQIYTVETVAIVGASFGFVNVVVARVRQSYSFLELAAINDSISENFNELKIKFLLLDPENQNYKSDLETSKVKMTTLENKIHPVFVRKCRSILCCIY